MWLSASQILGHDNADTKTIWIMDTFVVELICTHKNLKHLTANSHWISMD